MYFFLKPMFATFLAWLLLGESLQGIQVVAVMLIVLAMLIPRFSTFRLKSKKSLD
jgi:drug/metabolite transporter (DMT)-like permease